MPKPACPKCQLFYSPKWNGYSFLEGMPIFSTALAGKEHAADWQPYKLWHGDLWECRGCGAQVVVGCLRQVSEHYLPEFPERLKQYPPNVQINDC